MNLGLHPGRLVTAAATICLVAVGSLVWLFWPSASPVPGADRVRQYSNTRACLLTGADGVADPVAAAAWAGLQGASASSRAMVSYLPVPGAGSPAAVVPYVASLVQRQCTVIVAVGPPQVAAATSQAARYRRVRFIVITQGPASSAEPSTSLVVRIASAPAAQVHTAVQAAVTAAVNG